MAAIPYEIKNIINRYFLLLNENKIEIKNAYLFGSYASGNFNELSDIDIALVSDYFEGVRIKDKDKIRHITLSVSSLIETLPFNPKDFSKDNPLVKEIIETGVKLV